MKYQCGLTFEYHDGDYLCDPDIWKVDYQMERNRRTGLTVKETLESFGVTDNE